MNSVIQKIERFGILPVLTIEDVRDAVPLAQALSDAGLPVAEVVFHTNAADDAIRNMVHAVPEMIVGAGSVTTVEQVERALAAGAGYIAGSGISPVIHERCAALGIPYMPCISSVGEIELAMALGLDTVKVFPAAQLGGLPFIRKISNDYTKMNFIPEGGIHANNLNEYLSFSKVLACSGSWLAPRALISKKYFQGISALIDNTIKTMLGFSLEHVGINNENPEQASRTATRFCDLFGFFLRETPGAVFAGKAVEACKSLFLGSHGHIAIGTNDIVRAVAYLEAKGVHFMWERVKKDDKGRFMVIYLSEQVGGFAIHLVQRR